MTLWIQNIWNGCQRSSKRALSIVPKWKSLAQYDDQNLF
jgi:hypothetical protein